MWPERKLPNNLWMKKMENKITKILDTITSKEADLFTDEGLAFSGFSIPKEISKRNECFKGWSQSFSMDRSTQETDDLDQFIKILSTIDYQLLIDIYRNTLISGDVVTSRSENLKSLSLVTFYNNDIRLTDKGICFLTAFLSLKQIFKN